MPLPRRYLVHLRVLRQTKLAAAEALRHALAGHRLDHRDEQTAVATTISSRSERTRSSATHSP